MLIRRIAVRNIRSYNDGPETSVVVPDGTVLFEGDIGSGKSTLLYAIEFALFGLSDLKGTYLLSEGKEEGHVNLTFDSEGKEYTVHRSLKRRRDDVVQDECYIVSEGRRERLSSGDLKERVVSILKFKEPTHPKAESLVYRFAIFTPQEQMKAILQQNGEDRLQVIRHVLGAQSYQVAARNSELVARRVRDMCSRRLGESRDLDERKEELSSKLGELRELESRIPSFERRVSELRVELDGLEEKAREIRAKREEARGAEEKVPTIEGSIRLVERQLASNRRRSSEIATEVAELNVAIEAFKKSQTENSAKAVRLELDKHRDQAAKLESRSEDLEAELDMVGKLKPGELCPTCGQAIPLGQARTEHIESELMKTRTQLAPLRARIEELAELEEEAREFEQAKKDNALNLRSLEKLEAESRELHGEVRSLESDLESRKAELKAAVALANGMREVISIADELESRTKEARSAHEAANEHLVQARTRREDLLQERAALTVEIERKTKLRAEAQRLGSYEAWLSEYFAPTLGEIERRTLADANARFSHHFQRFFASLVDDSEMTVRVKEDFSPVFERQGFEQDFEALSGGERTSMALAYRFALNSVVREDISSQTELVILDEPTDGFSKEQVYKMRSLLEELDSRQVILVSHERELESMADHIFRVEKVNETSRVTPS